MGTCVPNQKPHMGVGISSTKYDKISLLNHIVVYFTDTTQFSTTRFRNVFNHFNGIIVKFLCKELH